MSLPLANSAGAPLLSLGSTLSSQEFVAVASEGVEPDESLVPVLRVDVARLSHYVIPAPLSGSSIAMPHRFAPSRYAADHALYGTQRLGPTLRPLKIIVSRPARTRRMSSRSSLAMVSDSLMPYPSPFLQSAPAAG